MFDELGLGGSGEQDDDEGSLPAFLLYLILQLVSQAAKYPR